jgi:hypothetical protein
VKRQCRLTPETCRWTSIPSDQSKWLTRQGRVPLVLAWATCRPRCDSLLRVIRIVKWGRRAGVSQSNWLAAVSHHADRAGKVHSVTACGHELLLGPPVGRRTPRPRPRSSGRVRDGLFLRFCQLPMRGLQGMLGLARREDRALLGSNPSARPGLESKGGWRPLGRRPFLFCLSISAPKRKIPGGLGDWSPSQKTLSSVLPSSGACVLVIARPCFWTWPLCVAERAAISVAFGG